MQKRHPGRLSCHNSSITKLEQRWPAMDNSSPETQLSPPHPGLTLLVKWLITLWMVGYSLAALVAALILIINPDGVACSIVPQDECSAASPTVLHVMFTMVGGVLGAGVLGMVSFHRYESVMGVFHIRHAWGFLYAPLLAGILALVVFALMQGGLLVFGEMKAPEDFSPITGLAYLAIGFLSGFGWYPATQKIEQIVARFFSLDSNGAANRGDGSDQPDGTDPATGDGNKEGRGKPDSSL